MHETGFQVGPSRVRGKVKTGGVFLGVMMIWAAGLWGCNSLFYYPDSHQYLSPQKLSLEHEPVRIESRSGNTLSAWRLLPKAEKLGTVVHFHGNAQNMSAHFFFVFWMAHFGFEVVTFDYSGYGDSEGEATRQNTVADGRSVLEWARTHTQGDLFVYAQSLGGAVAVPALAKSQDSETRAVALESTFASYRALAQAKLGQSWLTWPFQWPLSFLVSDELSPEDWIGKLNIPILLLHGSKDHIVPLRQARKLHEAAPRNRAELVVIPGAGHTPAMLAPPGKWRRRVIEFFCRHGSHEAACSKRLEEFDAIDDLQHLIPDELEDESP